MVVNAFAAKREDLPFRGTHACIADVENIAQKRDASAVEATAKLLEHVER